MAWYVVFKGKSLVFTTLGMNAVIRFLVTKEL
jgi:hypothetical protein